MQTLSLKKCKGLCVKAEKGYNIAYYLRIILTSFFRKRRFEVVRSFFLPLRVLILVLGLVLSFWAAPRASQAAESNVQQGVTRFAPQTSPTLGVSSHSYSIERFVVTPRKPTCCNDGGRERQQVVSAGDYVPSFDLSSVRGFANFPSRPARPGKDALSFLGRRRE